MTARLRFRDAFRAFVVPWLSDRPGQLLGKTVGFRTLWTMIAPLDAFAEVMIEALQAPWPGQGTPTALNAIGSTRGMLRGEDDTDEDFAARLVQWLDRARQIGSMLSTAQALHEYLHTRPRIRIFNRGKACLEVSQTGVVTSYPAGSTAWDWDSVSNPERAGYWWDLWATVYPLPFSFQGVYQAGSLKWGASPLLGLGTTATRVEHDAIRQLVLEHMSAHSHMRAIVFTSNSTLFDPTSAPTMPDGQWGNWSAGGSGSRVASHRNTSTCRYMEL